MNPLLLQALRCSNQSRPPVWLMRQAGRYLPEYRELRKKHSLWEMFHNPELAATVTRLPLDILNVDAAILFSDILVIAEAFGLTVDFPETGGPKILPQIRSPLNIENLRQGEISEILQYVFTTIRILKSDLRVPLIGFCGGPFTVASYMTDAGEWLKKDPVRLHQLLAKLTQASIAYLRLQIEAGVDAIQIFDSWANRLTLLEFSTFSLRYLKEILDALRETGIPLIVFCRNSSLLAQELASIHPSAISFDWHRELKELRQIVPPAIAVQGNLDPLLLKTSPDQIKRAVESLLHSMRGDPGFIVNLGHGVTPDIPVDHVRCFVDTVREF